MENTTDILQREDRERMYEMEHRENSLSITNGRWEEQAEWAEPEWAGSVGHQGDVFYFQPQATPPSNPQESTGFDNEVEPLVHQNGNTKIANGQLRTNNPDTNQPKKHGVRKRSSREKGSRHHEKENHHKDNNNHLSNPTSSSHGVTFQDTPTGVMKDVSLYVDPQRHNLGRRATLCESLLGIVPGHFSLGRSVQESNDPQQRDQRIMVQGLLPGGEAIKSGIKIGEWLQRVDGENVDFDNISHVLSAIDRPTQVTLTVQKICVQCPPTTVLTRLSDLAPSSQPLVQLLTGDRVQQEALSLENVPHGALYLTVDCQSEAMLERDDVLYQFPMGDSRLVDVRGAFITLSHMMVDVTNNTAKNCSLVTEGELVHTALCRENRELLVLYTPANKLSVLQLNCLLEDVVRVIKVLYGSLHSAFSQRGNHAALNHFFALVMQRHLLSEELITQGARQSQFLEPLLDVLPGTRGLTVPEEAKVIIHNCLSELEAGDFGEMSEDYFDLRRSYVILGSCLFYKGYLLVSHLHTEDLHDAAVYLQQQCLLTLCQDAQLGELLVWREVFPTRRCHKQVDPVVPGYMEPEARWFLMVVGMKNALMAVLLEAGGCAAWAEGHPTPDPFYVDQVKATLRHMEALDVFAHCEFRLQGPPVPSLACTDWFLPSHKGVKGEESGVTSLVQMVKGQSSPRSQSVTPVKTKPNQPESILKKRTHPSPGGEQRRLRAGHELESDADSVSTGTSDGSVHVGERRGRRLSLGSDDSLESGGSSGLFKGVGRKRRNLLSVFDLSDFKQGLMEMDAGDAQGSLVKLTTGCDNTLFHYVTFDPVEGVVVCPSQQEMQQLCTNLHDTVLHNFQQAALGIHAAFKHSQHVKELRESGSSSKFGRNDAMGQIQEQGTLFQLYHPTNSQDTKKPQTVLLSYWVVGRCLGEPDNKEFYVCFHDSVQQNAVEMAFKLGFGMKI